MDNRNRMTWVLGAGLILLGLFSLVGQFFGWGGMGNLWPLVVVGVGVAFFVGMVLGGKDVAGLAIPGSILTGIGLILLAQNLFSWWETWSYSWALIISFVGIGMVIQGYWSDNPDQRRRGWETARTGLILFLIFGALFEFIFSATGLSGRGGQALWAIVLVVAGALQLGFRLLNLLRGQAESNEARDLFGPIFLMGLGGVAYLSSLGSVYSDRLLLLLSLWPVLLIAGGITILFGRRSAIVSGLLGVGVVALMLTVMLAGDRLGLKPSFNWFSRGISYGEGVRVNGSGVSASKEFPVSGVRQVRHAAIGTLEITQGESESLVIEADDNVLPHFKVTTSGDRLTIEIERGYNISPKHEVHIRLTVKDLDRITLSGAGSASVTGLNTDDLTMELSGAGSLKVTGLQAQKLDVGISGAGSANASGSVQALTVTISGAGSFEADELQAEQAQVEIPGMGSARLWVTESLETRISGMGSISYFGSPSLSERNSGLGTVRSLGSK